ncbi:PREDICTED: ubiquitin carboxyl-terminal hydrolase MINDY-1-like [Camelina sativa]|uniref:Ubiquitin carboxyl-terminal hydrolase MINDY-1-like n=1 Tax=Camelina sativa TaxID=90675 RepID=A0ABM0U095_CAMSA|nr:PREDICTED: ubiquitin carboxyl-terminal hydrolase MINDY-1-like [Camelina sativa]
MAIYHSPPASPKSDPPPPAEEMKKTNQESQLKKKNETPRQVFYKTKEIVYRGRSKRIILQDKNGPCPLISICNVLILREEMNLGLGIVDVSQDDLLNHVADVLCERNDYECIDVELLRRLADGINVDINFESIKGFVVTPELALFATLGIPLYHGWIVDPQDSEIATAIGGRTYDALMTELTALDTQTVKAPSCKSSEECSVDFPVSVTASAEHGRLGKGDIEEEEALLRALTLSEKEAPGFDTHRDSNEAEEAVSKSSDVNGLTQKEGEVIKTFLKDNASQLTWDGLFNLEDELNEDELCVLYRNDHFSTMIKHGEKLFTLVSDQGYLMEQDLVWERLSQINGDSVFMTGNFYVFNRDSCTSRKWDQHHAITKTENVIPGINSEDSDDDDLDLQVAKELQRQIWAGETGSEVPVTTLKHISSSLQRLKEFLIWQMENPVI